MNLTLDIVADPDAPRCPKCASTNVYAFRITACHPPLYATPCGTGTCWDCGASWEYRPEVPDGNNA